MFIQTLKYGTVFCGVEYTTNNKEEYIYNVLVLKKKKKELNLLASKQFIELRELFDF